MGQASPMMVRPCNSSSRNRKTTRRSSFAPIRTELEAHGGRQWDRQTGGPFGKRTFLVSLVPTYESIGIWGAVILTYHGARDFVGHIVKRIASDVLHHDF